MILPGETACLKVAMPLSSSTPLRPFISAGRITATQARMARAALGISQGEVAKSIGCAIKTVCMFEQNTELVSRKNSNVIRAYYESLGIRFIDDSYFHTVAISR
jgi:DNA-binding XRE family transcriptional regulator